MLGGADVADLRHLLQRLQQLLVRLVAVLLLLEDIEQLIALGVGGPALDREIDHRRSSGPPFMLMAKPVKLSFSFCPATAGAVSRATVIPPAANRTFANTGTLCVMTNLLISVKRGLRTNRSRPKQTATFTSAPGQNNTSTSVLTSWSSGIMVNASGTSGASVARPSRTTISFVTGVNRIVRTTSKLFPRSARDWMSALPTNGSSGGAAPRSHLASNSRT